MHSPQCPTRPARDLESEAFRRLRQKSSLSEVVYDVWSGLGGVLYQARLRAEMALIEEERALRVTQSWRDNARRAEPW